MDFDSFRKPKNLGFFEAIFQSCLGYSVRNGGTAVKRLYLLQLYNVQNPLHTFPRNFPVDGEVANLLQTFYWHGQQARKKLL